VAVGSVACAVRGGRRDRLRRRGAAAGAGGAPPGMRAPPPERRRAPLGAPFGVLAVAVGFELPGPVYGGFRCVVTRYASSQVRGSSVSLGAPHWPPISRGSVTSSVTSAVITGGKFEPFRRRRRRYGGDSARGQDAPDGRSVLRVSVLAEELDHGCLQRVDVLPDCRVDDLRDDAEVLVAEYIAQALDRLPVDLRRERQ